ncbi:NUDIX hydrolase [Devosia sp.]|uniref:NUDIX hydrolase n=1 Tax=Devosia sp. TaxID=1871048 RepID=UPI0032668CA4
MNKVVFGPQRPKIEYARQLAALPWRVSEAGVIEVLMVTSRISQHWLLPKGWPMSGKTLQQAAAQEAYEEAGVTGKVRRKPAGRYTYDKLMKDGSMVPCTVVCFGMKVGKELPEWPEASQRLRQWFPLSDAAGTVFEPDLARFLGSEELQQKLRA